MKVIVFILAYLPGYKAGGPLQSIVNLVEACSDEFEFYIVAPDRDLGDTKAYPDIVYNQWVQVGKAKVRYLSPEQQNLKTIRHTLSEDKFDAMYLNSVWCKCWTIYPLIANFWAGPRLPVIQAVRGSLGDKPIRSKAYKKKPFLFLFYKLFGFAEKVVFQCSSQQEADYVRQSMGSKVQVCIVPNVPGVNIVKKPIASKQNGQIKLVFISRISRIKNLDGALESLKYVSTHVEFSIYGVQQDSDYWQKCLNIINQLPNNIKVEYKGELESKYVVDELSQYDCLFFPTHHENFGHVIHEALRAGLPVLTGKNTPWQQMQDEECGWLRDSTDHKGFAEIIDSLAEKSPDEFYDIKVRALNFAHKFAVSNNIVTENIEMFKRLLKK
ncbi:MAG: glycosyltransferase [Phycisphaerae bacterium]|nr:glycosyltransferase [Phycisphaerae bacterium]